MTTAPDYSAALARLDTSSPAVIPQLLTAAAAPLQASDIVVYLVDFEQTVLQPLLFSDGPVLAEEDVASTVAGRAFRTGEPVSVSRSAGDRVWVPLVEQSDRTGVLALTVPRAGPEQLAHCRELGIFAGLLIASTARYTDLLHIRRRARTMSIAAGMQWDMLPPLTLHSSQAVSCGILEPAYEIAGDGFDHAINEDWLHVALFDGMGHGIRSTVLTSLAIGAYRHVRREGDPLPAMHAAIDATVAEQAAGDAFVTGLLSRLHLPSGRLEWTTAGHPLPLLLRDRHVVGPLSCRPSLPFGLGDGRYEQVADSQLQPGDSVLFFTDGVVEGRGAAGEEFGAERLGDLWQRESIDGRAPEEVLRRLIQSIVDWQRGKLRDDATLVLTRWSGPAGYGDDQVPAPRLPSADGELTESG